MRLHNRLAVLMERKGRLEHRPVTISELSRKTGLPRNSVKKWLKDDVSQYSSPVVAAMCLYFGCRLDELLFLK